MRDPLPDGPYDAIVSALAIHHLEDADKRGLYGRVLEALAPGGLFVNADQMRGHSDEEEAAWLEEHRVMATALGTDEAEWAAALQRFTHDRHTTTGLQLDWLRELGFEDVRTAFDQRRFAVLVGRKPPTS